MVALVCMVPFSRWWLWCETKLSKERAHRSIQTPPCSAELRRGVGLTAGDIGAVVHRYDEHRYEVEFVVGSGDTVALLTLTDRDVRPVARSEILHARALAS